MYAYDEDNTIELNRGLLSIQSYVCCDTTIDDYNDNGTANFLNTIGLYFVFLQAIASTLMAMSKTDVRNYTKKLLSCSYVSCEADNMVDDEGNNIN